MSLFHSRMSPFFSRISKFSARRESFRFFSSLPRFPCLLLGQKKLWTDGIFPNSQSLLNATNEKTVCSFRDKKFPDELDGQTLIGASQGWVASLNIKDHTIHLTDLFKPWVLSPPRVISLPSLGGIMPSTAMKVSLSSSDPEDFFVAANIFDDQLSVCRPRCDSKWTHIEVSLLPPSELIYSKRNKAFYFLTRDGLWIGSLDLTNNYELKYQQVRYRNHATIFDDCSKHLLVESPSGELLAIIKSYREKRAKPFMVFRENENRKEFIYTEDIGDLCIFLGQNEPFCLSASMYTGLKPNSIYYIDEWEVGSYDIAYGKFRRFHGTCGKFNHFDGTYRKFNPFTGSQYNTALYWLSPADPIHEKGKDVGITPMTTREEVVEKVTKTFNKSHELQQEVAEKVTKIFSGNHLEEEVVEKREKYVTKNKV